MTVSTTHQSIDNQGSEKMTRKSCKYVLVSLMAAIFGTFGIARMSQNAVALGDERSSERAVSKGSSERASTSNVADEKLPIDPVASQIRPGDWNQWGGSPVRNNTPEGKNIATDWKAGQFDDDTGAWKRETAKNVKWVARLGTKSNGNAAVANGKVYVGTNNGGGYLKRYPSSVHLGRLLCLTD